MNKARWLLSTSKGGFVVLMNQQRESYANKKLAVYRFKATLQKRLGPSAQRQHELGEWK